MEEKGAPCTTGKYSLRKLYSMVDRLVVTQCTRLRPQPKGKLITDALYTLLRPFSFAVPHWRMAKPKADSPTTKREIHNVDVFRNTQKQRALFANSQQKPLCVWSAREKKTPRTHCIFNSVEDGNLQHGFTSHSTHRNRTSCYKWPYSTEKRSFVRKNIPYLT